jgi:hypothetical protein
MSRAPKIKSIILVFISNPMGSFEDTRQKIPPPSTPSRISRKKRRIRLDPYYLGEVGKMRPGGRGWET